jgi:hypothetical protein
MDTRRFRKHSQSEALAQFRWLGWVMLMMFVLVQTAPGADTSCGRLEGAHIAGSLPSQATAAARFRM